MHLWVWDTEVRQRSCLIDTVFLNWQQQRGNKKNRGRERVIRLLSKRTQVIHCSTETAECSHNTVARLGSKIGKYQVFSLYQFLWYNVSGHSQTRVSMQGNNGKKPQQVQFPLTTPRQAPLFKRLVSTVFHRLNIFTLLTFLMQNTVPYLKHSSSPPGLSPGDNDNTYGQQLIIKSGTYWTGLPDSSFPLWEASGFKAQNNVILFNLVTLFS